MLGDVVLTGTCLRRNGTRYAAGERVEGLPEGLARRLVLDGLAVTTGPLRVPDEGPELKPKTKASWAKPTEGGDA
ncbi:hypothetical protein P7L78_26450 [Tistrella bauzanensis]|uniref:hypothetical protein n=1 Tax=Tistrella TaxID=171436 RepID=UPI0031F616DB